MADHSELVSELPLVEKLSTQERLKHARKRRQQQLKRWQQKEQQQRKKQQPPGQQESSGAKRKKRDYKVHFVPSVMLLEAAARNDVEEVRRLLLLGVSPDSTNEDGLTALHQCCIDDSEAMLLLLLDAGASADARDSERWTPLHAAAACGHLRLARLLAERGGADLLAVNADGNMPYDLAEDAATLDYLEARMAAQGVTQEMIDETRGLTERRMLADLRDLVRAGGDLEARDAQGAAPLHVASANGYVSVVEFVLEQHGSTHVADDDLWQPVHAAACWGHPDVIEMLVAAGADLAAKTKNGETPFDICEDPDLKERILQLKSEIETKRAAQPQKLRRSHSHNTRSQSVRRTSIRDKSLISRREAREEARMRHRNGSGTDEEEEKIQQDMEATEKGEEEGGADEPQQRREGAEPEADVGEDPCRRPAPESVKVEIHVTVNTAAPPPGGCPHGTLSDLKRHRADLRSLVLSGEGPGGPAPPFGRASFALLYEGAAPPSPALSPRRFCSDPSEVVGGDARGRGCCLIM